MPLRRASLPGAKADAAPLRPGTQPLVCVHALDALEERPALRVVCVWPLEAGVVLIVAAAARGALATRRRARLPAGAAPVGGVGARLPSRWQRAALRKLEAAPLVASKGGRAAHALSKAIPICERDPCVHGNESGWVSTSMCELM